ncbi:MAG: tyrosinase [Burkholderiales bacterium]
MSSMHFSRRGFIKGSASTLALAALPGGIAYGQTVARRLEWQEFKTTPSYLPFVNAIRTMRANTNANDQRSWNFWVNAHVNNCPHGTPYFLAWHRGFAYYFERQLRTISGLSTLTLPYWDYYKYATIPTEFTTPSTNNPLYVGRVNTNIRNALSLDPFRQTNFQRGTPSSFEASLEPRPHGEIHNLIGGAMASLQSPTDPIFWLHHSQIDRLLHAWVLSGGKRYPASTDPYWNGTLTYSATLTIARRTVYNPATLGYTYSDTTLPKSIPPLAAASGRFMDAPIQGAQSPLATRVALQGVPARPSAARFPNSEPRPTGKSRYSIGGAWNITLDEASVSARIPVEPSDVLSLRRIAGSTQASPFGGVGTAAQAYRSAQVILDNVRTTPAGEIGGYFYDVYLNLPPSAEPPTNEQRYHLGSFGAFEVSTAHHHGNFARLVFSATQLLRNFSEQQLREILVSFVRVNGDRAPRGPAIKVGEMRIELSNDDVE